MKSFSTLKTAKTWILRLFKRGPTPQLRVTLYPSALGLEVAAHLDKEYPGWRKGDWKKK